MSGFLLYGDTFRNPNVFFVTGFVAPDPIAYVKSDAGETLAVPPLEKTRAQKESRIEDVRSFDDLGYVKVLEDTGDAMTAMASIIERMLREDDSGPFMVEPSFPVILADFLRGRGITIEPRSDLLIDERRHKSTEQIEAIAHAQARAEQAITEATAILAEAEIHDGSLIFRGVPLTAERLRAELEMACARDNFVNDSMIVAPGPPSSDPHWFGSGPIKAHQPLILDIFPQDRQSRYHGDVTRTFVKGEPLDEIKRMYESVRKAQSKALGMIAPGVNGRDVHQAVVSSFSDDGYGNGASAAKYTHGTGHGLGLEVHEQPRLSRVNMELREGDVVTVEPGLYDPRVGGVRIEDVVVVTSDRNRNLNHLPKELVVQ